MTEQHPLLWYELQVRLRLIQMSLLGPEPESKSIAFNALLRCPPGIEYPVAAAQATLAAMYRDEIGVLDWQLLSIRKMGSLAEYETIFGKDGTRDRAPWRVDGGEG